LGSITSIVISKQNIFSCKCLNLAEQFPLNLTLNPKP
jgi:hypothetical protein